MKFLRIICTCSYHPSCAPACKTEQELIKGVRADLLYVSCGLCEVNESFTTYNHQPDKFKLETETLVRIE